MSAELTPLQRAFMALEDTRARLAEAEARASEPIAIVGMACRFPAGANSPDEYWELLRDGRDGVSTVPLARWDHAPFLDPSSQRPGTTYAQHAGFIEQRVDTFDAPFFGISPREAASMDPQQRLLLEETWEALEHAGIPPDRLAGSATGVFVGIPAGDYLQLQQRGGTLADIDAHWASGFAHSIASGRISYLLDLQGPSISLDTACSSSLVAVHQACQSLRARESNLALAGGVNLILSPESFVGFARTHMLAADGRCKTFDASADGFVRGEGCGIVVLKRLRDAQRDGDRILAVIRGTAVNQDGASASLTAPSGPSQEAVIRSALAQAGLSAADVQFVEGHGTGTSLGDPIELRALGAVYGARRTAESALVVGSVKSNFGHLEGAAGVASLIKLVLALDAARVPGQLHVTRPTPHVDWDALHLRLPAPGGEAWPAAKVRRGGVSSFGFSGTNVHLVVEAAPAAVLAADNAPRVPQLVPIAARTARAARHLAQEYARELGHGLSLVDLASTASTGRAQLQGARATVVAGSTNDAIAALHAIARGENITVRTGTKVPKAAFLFTGQGAQSAGMGRELFESAPVFRDAIHAAARVLDARWDGVTLADVLYGADSERLLADARYVQPAIVAVELALAALWRSWGVEPAVVAGHSLGEYAAAAFAGAMSVDDALTLVAERGRLMAALPPQSSAMTSIPAPWSAVQSALGDLLGPAVELAANNGPSQTVLTGSEDGIDRAEARVRAALGVEPKRLQATTNAFHSRFIEPMLDAFEAVADTVRYSAPHLPVCWNLGADARASNAAPDARYWREQTRHPVQFGEAIHALASRNITHAIEIGPHPVLTALASAGDGEPAAGLASLRRGKSDWATIAASAAAWWQDGGTIDWIAYTAPAPRRVVTLPSYPFERERHWLSYARVSHTPRRAQSAHPLIGARLRSPALDGVVFETAVRVADQPLLEEHRVHGRAVLPGAAWLDAFSTAGRDAFGGAWSVRDLTLRSPLDVGDDETRVVQVIVRSTESVHEVSSFSRADTDDAEWIEHARATLVERGDVPVFAAADVPVRSERDAGALYDRFRRIGLSLGPLFHRVVGTAQGERTARVAIDGSLRWDSGVMHPALIDACIQAVALAIPPRSEDDATLYMPLAFEQFDSFAIPTDRFVASAFLRSGSSGSETVVADVVAIDDDGRLIAQLRGVTLKRANARSLRWTSERDSLYELQWQPVPSLTVDGGAVLSEVASRVVSQAPARAAESGLDRYGTAMPEVERLAAMYVWRAVWELATSLPVGRRLAAASVASELGVLPRHALQLGRLLTILEEDGALSRSPDGWVVQRVLDDSGLEALRDQLRTGTSPLAGELELMVRCGEHLAGALSGRVDPLELLFPGGSLESVHRIYRDSPAPIAYNALVRDAVATLAAQRVAARPLRILEVGGGTGGTTAAILDAIPAGRCEYVFTDASALFLARARERFAHRTELTFRVLDLELDVDAQGFAGNQFDMLVGANVIHATRDLTATFERLRPHLAPGALLLMLEMSRPSRWVDLSFGLTEGWWAFADRYRVDYPLLAPAMWVRVLEDAGFTDVVTSLGTPSDALGLREQTMILARMPEATVAADPATWLVLVDSLGVGHAIASRLEQAGDRVVRVSTASTATAGDAAPLDPMSRDALQQFMLRTSGQQPFRGVIDCWPMDDAGILDAADTPARAAHAAQSALAVAQAVLTSTGNTGRDTPRLWFVTRGAVRTNAGELGPDAAQATVWGIARTLTLEHPELRASCLDLTVDDASAVAEACCAELRASGVESQVALRQAGRLVARVDHSPRVAPAFPCAYQVVSRERGAIETLDIVAREVPSPGIGEVVVRVSATGLNFKDVLNVLGTYPGDPGPLGGECSGRIVAVGAQVAGLHVGDQVVTVVSAAMSSHVVVDARLCAPVPAGMSLERAAALPIAYVTAYHCLIELGALQRGERVLIHAAAGGVGMAAVHLAQRAGAEVFATAGSEAKRAYLRSLGVRHVFDSRSTVFADAILALTDGEGVHVTLNSLADAFVERSLAATARGGRFLEIGKRGIWSADRVAALNKSLSYHIVDWTDLPRRNPDHLGRMLRTLLTDVGGGELAPLPVEEFPLSRITDAFRYMAQGRHTGKIVISHREALDAAGAYPVSITPGAAYVVAGGTSGLGLLTAEWLAARGASHLVLFSRSGGDDGTRATVAKLASAGVRVDVAAIDVSDAAALDALLAATRMVSPICGVIQSAGSLDDGAVLQLDAARMASVFAAKVTGTWNLHALTRTDALDFFICYASVAGFLGSPGQANHASGNTFIDALAQSRRGSGLPAVSIDWGAWDDIGAAVRHGVVSRIANVGLRSLSPDEGLRILADVMEGSSAQVAALPVDWQTFLAARNVAELPVFERVARRASPSRVALSSPASSAGPTSVAQTGTTLVQELSDAVPARRPAVLRGYLRTRVAMTLGLSEGRVVDDRQALRDAGLDSLLAIELRNVLGVAVGRTLPATLLFDYPTIDDLAVHLLATLFPAAPDTAAAESTVAAETPANLIEGLTSMSDDDVDRLFAEKMRGRT